LLIEYWEASSIQAMDVIQMLLAGPKWPRRAAYG
jgi:hypothetical protein